MRIGIVVPGGLARQEGLGTIPFLHALVTRLAVPHELFVLMLWQGSEPAQYPVAGAMVENVGGAPGVHRLRRALSVIRREHRRRPFDLLHAFWAGPSGFVCTLAGKLLHIPTVVTVAGGEMAALPDIGYGGALRLRDRAMVSTALRLANAVTCPSLYTLREVRKRRPDAHQIVIGPDCTRFQAPLASLPAPPWRLLHVADLNPVKDQTTLLKAFAAIRQAEPQSHLDVIGFDTLNGAVQRNAAELGLASAVTFHGHCHVDDVVGWMQRSHLLVHSARSEAGPLVLLEAAACRLPAVGTAVGLFPELAPEAAVSVPIGDHTTLASAALALLGDADSRMMLAMRARDYAMAHSIDETAARYLSLYTSLQDSRQIAGARLASR
jgi:glycosyltransferase involved in cell wall biosynthesis